MTKRTSPARPQRRLLKRRPIAPQQLDDEDIESMRERLLVDAPKAPYLRIARQEVHRVLAEFVALAKGSDCSPAKRDALIRFAASAFHLLLSGKAKTLDHAFGLVRRGAPVRNNDRFQIAYEVLVEMDHGSTLEDAGAVVDNRWGKSDFYARDAYVYFLPILRPDR